MEYIRILPGNKPQIIKDIAFCELLNNKLPSKTKPITELIAEFDEEIKKVAKSVSKDALNNVHGDWYEWLLAITAWNYCVENKNANLALLMPNISQFDVAKLYNEKIYSLIQDLRDKVFISSNVQLITSNPDFVIIDRKIVEKTIQKIQKITTINQETIKYISTTFRKFTGKCNFEGIHGYIAVKTSLRPDRRLQISHEGSLMKAIYTHLQTREWILEPNGIKYYAISTKIGEPDREALKTVATHSITSVQSKPQAAVDGVFEVDSLEHAVNAFSEMLNS